MKCNDAANRPVNNDGMRTWCAAVCLLLTSAALPAADRYEVRYDQEQGLVDVKACFDGGAPRGLDRSSRAAPYAKGPWLDGEPIDARGSGSRLKLPVLPDDSCLAWRVDLSAAADDGDYRTAFRTGSSLGVNTRLWFWRTDWRRPVNVKVFLADGVAFSTPWPSTVVDGERIYTPARTPVSWSSRTLFGRFELREIAITGASIKLAMTGALDADKRDAIATWIRSTVESVASVFGYFPRAHVQVIVVPIGHRGEAVPWAHVLRGGGPAVEFFIDENRPLAEFQKDWTATHEFSHLLLPYVASDDRWLSEGLASYYQNVLRARDGRLSDMQAWQKLHDGFQRGERGTGDGTLAEATRSGDSIMRIYWSGAAMLLKVDTRLRERSGGRQSLDSALARLNACCSESGKRWRAWDLMQELDRLTGTEAFTGVYREHVHTEDFPDVSEIYRELGLDSRLGRIRAVPGAPLQGIRNSIMAPDPG